MESTANSVLEGGLRNTETFTENYDTNVYAYINNNTEYRDIHHVDTIYRNRINGRSEEKLSSIVNLSPINNVRYINKFFEKVNAELEFNGLYIGCFQCKEQHKKQILGENPGIYAAMKYGYDFLWNRVVSKLAFTKAFYFQITKGWGRVLPLAEVLGRLVSCGFKILDYTEIDGKYYFTAQKINDPTFDNNPTYGPLITLNRIGKGGKLIKVYKFRTMHSYAEYLQQFVYQKNDVQNGGKFRDDFRITNWGKILRKFWLDELPMLFNWLKGELKLVGVRPISRHYFELYPKRFRERRIQYKPGLIPPYYADLPETMDEIFASEKKYMMEYSKHPVLTDIKYFIKSVYNIFIKRARSK